MANLLGTTVNGALSASGRISVTYDTDRYQFNFLRASGSNWWVTNDTGNLGLHLNNVGDKFYFSTGGDFYSDTNGWLSTALAGKSNVGHTHDDRYYTESESDLRFQPIENQRLSTSNNVTFNQVYSNNWFRNNAINTGLYQEAGGGNHWYAEDSNIWTIGANGSYPQIRFRSGGHQGTIRGYVYADTSNQIGFLNNGGGWNFRTTSDKNAFIHGQALTINADNAGSSSIYMNDGDEGMRELHCNSNRIGFLTQAGSWGAYADDSANWFATGYIQSFSSMYSPIYYDGNNSSYYVDPDGTSLVNSIVTRGTVNLADGSYYGTLVFGQTAAWHTGISQRDAGDAEMRIWAKNADGSIYLATGHDGTSSSTTLPTDGMAIKYNKVGIGNFGAHNNDPTAKLHIRNSVSGGDALAVDGINGRLFTVTDDLSGSLFSVNTIAGLPVIEAFADNTVTIGKYGYATTWSTTGFMTVPNSANIYRDLFINGGRGGDFGNRLIIGTDAATYTLNDSNQRPVAYLHGQYPVLTLNHTVTSNTEHGPTIQLTHHTNNKQWVIGSNGTGTRLDIGYSENTDRNPHNGIGDYNGSTFIRVDNSGNVQLGRGNGRSTWVNDTLYVGASDSGDSHMYFGEDSSGWYGLHWYWDSAYTVYLYGRNAGTDTEIMRYTTNSNAYVEWRRHFHMNNYEINYVSQLHFNNNTRFVNNSNNYLNFQIGSDSYGSIQVRDNSNNLKGYLGYFDSSGFGLLNSSGNWGIRLAPGNVEAELFYAGTWRVRTGSAGIGVNGNVYIDQDFGFGIVGLYDSYRYQGIFAMGDAYKLAANGQSTGNLYGLAWTHTNVGGQSKAGLEHQLLVMNYGTTLTAIGNGIWTAGTITTVNHGNSSQWNTAYGWGDHSGLYVRAYGTTADNIDADWGQSFKTFDPVPSGTPPIASPNIRTINVGENFSRRTQLAFTYATDQAWFRRRDDGGWQAWREFIHSGNIGSQSVSYATSAGSASSATIASTVTVNSGNTSAGWYPIVWHSGNTVYSSSGVEIYAAGNYIRSQYINTTDNDEGGITRFVIKNGDNYHRSATTTVAADIIRGVASGTWSINVTGTAGGETLATVTSRGATTSGSIYVNGDIFMMGTPTTTNQARTIDFTGFDKEGTTDFSDRAYIQHTTNTGGHAGSVLVLSSQNDADDGIAFLTNASSQLRHNSNVIWTAGNDGSGSGLDADLIDGVDSSRIVFGDGARASTYVGSMDDPNQKSGFFFKDGPTGQPFGDWWNWLTVAGNSWQSSNNYSFQIAHAFHSDDAYIRRMTNGTAYSWRTLITSGNIGSQSVNYATSAGSATSSTSASYASGLSRYGIIYGNDWNSYNVNGQFIVMSAHNHSGSNRPSGAYNYGSGMSYYNSGSDHYQFYFPENSGSSNGNSHKIWYRSGWNNSWGGWRSIVDIYNSVCYIDGAITATGDITAFSDARVKENVETLEGALDKTLKLRGVSYTRTDVEDKSKKIGVIAQEILEVVPEVVSQDENGMYAVSYGNITALLIEAIKEQQKQIDELKEIINGLTR